MVFIFLRLFGWHVLHVHGNWMQRKIRGAGLKVVFSPFFGWNAAIVSMFCMDAHKRKKLLG